MPSSSTTVMWAAHDSQQSKQRTTISKIFTTPSGTSLIFLIHAFIVILISLFNPWVW
ncbi:MAG: hypothetical protein ACTSQJ_04505 [Promethearchaeota archaeon]